MDAVSLLDDPNNPINRELEGTIAQVIESAEKHQCIFIVARMVCVDDSVGFCGIPAEQWEKVALKMATGDMIKEFIPVKKIVPKGFN